MKFTNAGGSSPPGSSPAGTASGVLARVATAKHATNAAQTVAAPSAASPNAMAVSEEPVAAIISAAHSSYARPSMVADAAPMPRNAVVILLDSLNRHLLGAYGSTEFETPNLDRLARRS